MATSGTFSRWIDYSGDVSFSGDWSVSISRGGTSNTATVTVTVHVYPYAGDESFYYLYVNGTKVKTDDNIPHYEGATYTLTHSYNVTAADAGGTATGTIKVRAQTHGTGSYADSATGNFSISYPAKTKYTISYNANGGSGAPASQTKYYGTTLKLSTTKPSRSGYTFSGWATSSGGSVAYASGANYTANSAATLYAVWSPNITYTVTYNANGGSGVPDPQSGYSGTSLSLSSTKPTKASTREVVTVTYEKVEDEATLSKSSDECIRVTTYSFSKWNTKADGTGTNYTAGQNITLSANLTLYAIYTATTAGSVELPTGTLDQYVLTGWSASESDVSILPSPYSPTGDVTLYAIWAPNGMGAMLKFQLNNKITLSPGDKVRLVGMKDPENDGVYTVASYSCTYTDEDWEDPPISIDGLIPAIATVYFEENFVASGSQDASELQLEIYGDGTYVPDMDYICSLNNRLWGCSSYKRTIYASALGDPTDFWTFAGDALDAYQVAVGSAGEFTGCVAMNNTVLFMKQHCIHKMLGSYPAEYALYTYAYDGVSEGNYRSLLNCDGTAIYVTEHGIGTYAGATTGVLSHELGEGNMNHAVAGFDGVRYVLSYQDNADQDHTYVYDMRYRIWLERDYGHVLSFAHLIDDDYVLIEQGDGNGIYKINSEVPLEDEWEMLYKVFIESSSGSYRSTSEIFEKKRYTGLTFRLELPPGSWIKAEICVDRNRWVPAARALGRKEQVTEFVLRTPRCDKMQLRLSGYGPMKILSMEREYTIGSRR